MKKQLIFFALSCFITIESYSQISFESGYFINDLNQKTECFIKNSDWLNNPTEFTYKQSKDSEEKIASIKNVIEFGINNASKYVRSTVKIDKSSDSFDHMNFEKKPLFIEEQLFLKVLVEGNAKLYLYNEGNLIRFFYNVGGSTIEPLIFKTYKTTMYEVAKNNSFRQQLWSVFEGQCVSKKDIENISYDKKELVNLFVKYNQCSKSESIIFENIQKRDLFNFTLKVGLKNTSLQIQNTITDRKDTDFGNKVGVDVGVEAEFVMPFNKNKWAFIIQPTYQYFKSEIPNKFSGDYIREVNYQSIEIPFGIRYYYFLNNDIKLFATIAMIVDLPIKSYINFKNADGSNVSSLEIKPNGYPGLGFGCKVKDRYNMEIRGFGNRNILGYSPWVSEYKTVSLTFGYTLF